MKKILLIWIVAVNLVSCMRSDSSTIYKYLLEAVARCNSEQVGPELHEFRP